MNQIEKVARAKLVDELALAIDQFLTHQIERDTLACDLTQDELTELATGVAAIAAMPVQAEPVAWMYQVRRVTNFSVSRARDTFPEEQGWTETPLYAHPPAQWQGIESASDAEIIRLTEALRAAEERETALREDKARLDYLDKCNHRLNSRYGTSYGWKLILNHNVNRLMLDTPSGMAVDLHDTEVGSAKFTSCRKAIDESMLRAAIAGAKP